MVQAEKIREKERGREVKNSEKENEILLKNLQEQRATRDEMRYAQEKGRGLYGLAPTTPNPPSIQTIQADIYLYTERRKTKRQGGEANVNVLAEGRGGGGANEDDSKKHEHLPKYYLSKQREQCKGG